MTEIPPFPEVVDSTMRSALVSCHRKFYWEHLRHLRRHGISVDLHFGGCVATGLREMRRAFYRDGRSAKEALCVGATTIIEKWGDFEMPDVPAPKSYKTLAAALDAIASYAERWPLADDRIQPYRAPDGTPLIEHSFAIPIEGTQHPTTGNPIVYAGRFDMVGCLDGIYAVPVDEKTSSQLGTSWRNNWRMRGQLTGYVYALQWYGLASSDAIVRGIGILKGDITFDEVPEARPQWQVEAWLRQLRNDINAATAAWKLSMSYPEPREAWSQALDTACSNYGGCPMLDLCDSANPERWVDEYEISQWDPLADI